MPHDVDESQLDAMAARVAAVVTEEQAAESTSQPKPLPRTSWPSVRSPEKGDGHSALRRCSEGNLFMCLRRRRSSGLASLGTDACPPGGSAADEAGVKYREVAAHYEKLAQEASDATKNRQRAFPPSVFGNGPATQNTSRGVNACLKFTLANTDPHHQTGRGMSIRGCWAWPTAWSISNRGTSTGAATSDYIRRACLIE